LYFAAFNGREQTSKHLIENGADVNTADYLGFTPLMVAAMKGYYVIVDYFLQKGAEVNAKNISGNTALIIAVDHQRQKTTENLIKAGADVNYSGDTALKPLFYASRHGTKFYVDILLNAGADINAKSNESITPLFMAITFGRELLAEEYLGRGAVFYPVNVGPVDIYHTAMCYQFAANYYQKQAETQKAKDNFQLAIKYFNDAIPALKAHSRKLWWSGVLISTTPQGQQSSSNDFALSAEIDEYIKKSQDNIAECQQKLAVL
jgi:ankyrin repeat protein